MRHKLRGFLVTILITYKRLCSIIRAWQGASEGTGGVFSQQKCDTALRFTLSRGRNATIVLDQQKKWLLTSLRDHLSDIKNSYCLTDHGFSTFICQITTLYKHYLTLYKRINVTSCSSIIDTVTRCQDVDIDRQTLQNDVNLPTSVISQAFNLPIQRRVGHTVSYQFYEGIHSLPIPFRLEH